MEIFSTAFPPSSAAGSKKSVISWWELRWEIRKSIKRLRFLWYLGENLNETLYLSLLFPWLQETALYWIIYSLCKPRMSGTRVFWETDAEVALFLLLCSGRYISQRGDPVQLYLWGWISLLFSFLLSFPHAVCLSFLSCEHHPVNFEQALPHLEIKRQQLTTASFTRALSSKLFVQSLPSFFLLHVYIPHVPTSSASLHDPRFVTIPRLHKYLRAHLFLQAFSLPVTGSAGAVVQAVLHTPACLPAWSPQHHKLLNQSCASSRKHRRTEP